MIIYKSSKNKKTLNSKYWNLFSKMSSKRTTKTQWQSGSTFSTYFFFDNGNCIILSESKSFINDLHCLYSRIEKSFHETGILLSNRINKLSPNAKWKKIILEEEKDDINNGATVVLRIKKKQSSEIECRKSHVADRIFWKIKPSKRLKWKMITF